MQEFFQNSVTQLKALVDTRTQALLELRSSMPHLDQYTRDSVDILTRHVRLFGKFFRRVQQLSVAKFVLLPMCNDVILFYWGLIVQASESSSELLSGGAL